MKIVLALSILWSLGIGAPVAAAEEPTPSDKSKHIANCLDVVHEVLCPVDSKILLDDLNTAETAKIDKQVAKISSLEDLQYLTRLLEASYYEVQELPYRFNYRRVERAEYAAAVQISKMHTPDAIKALKSIRAFHSGNETFSLTLDELLQIQSRPSK